MKTTIHRASQRGIFEAGWLKSAHSFSFGSYYDPTKMGFGLLRVLNDDWVRAGMGFSTHPHENMEIVSIPLSGALRHQDSAGRDEVIKTNDVQIMSAGNGIYHSEQNNSKTDPVEFLQVWVEPKEYNIEPRYQQLSFLPKDRQNQLSVVVSPEGKDGGVGINQDSWFSLGSFRKGLVHDYRLFKPGNGLYIFVLSGEIKIGLELLKTRDAIGIEDVDSIPIHLNEASEFVCIEIPMHRKEAE